MCGCVDVLGVCMYGGTSMSVCECTCASALTRWYALHV